VDELTLQSVIEAVRSQHLLHWGGTHGTSAADATIATCWDADRLDLGRVGTMPRPERLCTEAARDPWVIAWAWGRSLKES